MNGDFFFPIQLSILVACIAAAVSLILAVLAAYRTVMTGGRGSSVLETVYLLPLVLPPSVLGFLLLFVFGMNSPVGQTVELLFGQTILFSKAAAVIAAVIVSFPLMYQSVKTGFAEVNRDIVGASKVDGASNWKAFYHVVLPLAKQSIVMGVILGFTRALGEFGATLMFAGNIPGKTQTISTAIYVAIESGESHLAWKYAGVSIGLSFLLLFLMKWLDGRKER
ncbi:molybdate ABC transporter permease subunit [Rossellomorea aquimaris]|uniref:Molybdenum transport system permease n=1 Tax=Rossellomorea aquimaris TaxID=189382 RepID=A0A1J6VU08_9BACI|nr:molybdate ABC transporter permease subunit [Rossellomorea aquimaris]OIU68730.1 molybdenum ABC transporter permease subunit [Rossellomorea aquimaris]